MKDIKECQGIFSALVTPMHDDESVNWDMLRQVVRYELERGVEGFYCCGSSGEGLLLSLDERKRILETVLDETAGRVKVITHIGTIRTRDVIDLGLHAKAAGADAVSMIPPFYYKFSIEEIVGYYTDVAEALKDIGVIVYNIPQFTGVNFEKVHLNRLLNHENIIGIKHTSQDLYGLERIMSAHPNKAYFNGFDEMFLPAVSLGVTSTIGTTVNLYPQLFKGVRDSMSRNEMKDAQSFQNEINRNVEIMCSVGIFNAVKYIFGKIGFDCGTCRSPFKSLNSSQVKALDDYLSEYPIE